MKLKALVPTLLTRNWSTRIPAGFPKRARALLPLPTPRSWALAWTVTLEPAQVGSWKNNVGLSTKLMKCAVNRT